MATKAAIVGCGFVSYYYVSSASNWTEQFTVVGVFDVLRERAQLLATHEYFSDRQVTIYSSFEELLADQTVEIVLNLTNVSSHYQINLASLSAGKHVYSEKPLAINMEEVKTLVELAEKKCLILRGAPCNYLGEHVRTALEEIREGSIGKISFVKASVCDGRLPFNGMDTVQNELGVPWPLKEELENGCNLEHTGYILTILVKMFGAVRSVKVVRELVHPKADFSSGPVDVNTCDHYIAFIALHSGVKAEINVSVAGEHKRCMTFFGEKGDLTICDVWSYASQLKKTVFDEPQHYRCTDIPHRTAPSFHQACSKGFAYMDLCRVVALMAQRDLIQLITLKETANICETVFAIQSASQAP
eukprot:CAMPEP_0183796424 /NCGR_PEP_ID=MMETSP0803_2-20130417/10630_1 /TAXON_ID=195967 /ORGANISM="Crustomastix stigmata, Strain CCMP3273" /LENGTH=358 /DNA_ID=CAMNT_0026041059 /DNA_START=343 /DNA_END=1415 /DNA_ORIENTATION=+